MTDLIIDHCMAIRTAAMVLAHLCSYFNHVLTILQDVRCLRIRSSGTISATQTLTIRECILIT